MNQNYKEEIKQLRTTINQQTSNQKRKSIDINLKRQPYIEDMIANK